MIDGVLQKFVHPKGEKNCKRLCFRLTHMKLISGYCLEPGLAVKYCYYHMKQL